MEPAPQQQPAKPSWQSKPFCLMVLTALSPLIARFSPDVAAFVRDNSDLVCTAVGLAAGFFGWQAPSPKA